MPAKRIGGGAGLLPRNRSVALSTPGSATNTLQGQAMARGQAMVTASWALQSRLLLLGSCQPRRQGELNPLLPWATKTSLPVDFGMTRFFRREAIVQSFGCSA